MPFDGMFDSREDLSVNGVPLGVPDRDIPKSRKEKTSIRFPSVEEVLTGRDYFQCIPRKVDGHALDAR